VVIAQVLYWHKVCEVQPSAMSVVQYVLLPLITQAISYQWLITC